MVQGAVNMLSALLRGINDFSVLTRALFYHRHIPVTLPNFAQRLFEFSTQGKASSVESEHVDHESLLALTSNVRCLYNVDEEETLWRELHVSSIEGGKLALGAVLISGKVFCRLCKRKLSAKPTRSVNVIIYHEKKGTFMGCRIPKVCSNRQCNFTQHYGYYTIGDNKFFDEDWNEHEYFVCSRKTVFDMMLLSKFEYEILLGKISFKEKADIYNAVNGYDDKGCDCDKESESGDENGVR